MISLIPRTFFLLGFTMLALTRPAAAAVIEFTTGEGYTDGNLWQQTPTSGDTWNTVSDFQVNTSSGGSVTASTGTGSYSFPARYSAAFSSTAGQALSLSLDFRFLGVNVTTAPGSSSDRQYLSGLNFGPTSSGVFDGVIGGNIMTFEFAPANTYTVQVFSGAFTTFAPSDVGLTNTGGTMSDNLRLTLTTTIASAGNSSYTLSLFDLDTSTAIFSLDGSADLSSYSSLYAAFAGGGSPVAETSLVASRLDVSSVPEPSTLAFLLGGAGISVLLRRSLRAAR